MRRLRVAVRIVEEENGVATKILMGDHVYVFSNEATPTSSDVTNCEGKTRRDLNGDSN